MEEIKYLCFYNDALYTICSKIRDVVGRSGEEWDKIKIWGDDWVLAPYVC
jgi:hypothetical protein